MKAKDLQGGMKIVSEAHSGAVKEVLYVQVWNGRTDVWVASSWSGRECLKCPHDQEFKLVE